MLWLFVGGWRWLAVRGVLAILFGVATLVWPGVTLWVLILLWGAFMLVDGAFGLVAAITDRVERNRGWWALAGIAGIAAGVIALVWPGVTALALLFIIAAWALIVGISQLATAVRLRKEIEHDWVIALTGVLSVALAVVLFASPGAGVLAITWAIGWFATLFGVLLCVLAWRVWRQSRERSQADLASR
ncbi:hypothetical protein SacmaDRAFT_2547 [Saccharomonospora marina XMU15]|uniref:HdeD family acid-resistance protein n=1 Tax=Saccharomonospora marina XMU15 TaxID=882083 RepID=H5WZQ8_9PSEU|nr:DUF308 domain-containing protein [Saccharomonospora marina]EHR50790.1 hypothetical protein SacmaDRAFT_2547 [Saccharomonospora marina XMU15]